MDTVIYTLLGCGLLMTTLSMLNYRSMWRMARQKNTDLVLRLVEQREEMKETQNKRTCANCGCWYDPKEHLELDEKFRDKYYPIRTGECERAIEGQSVITHTRAFCSCAYWHLNENLKEK